jgi:nicotinamidase-related amidase
VLAGIATSLGVESTAREARDRGFNVVLAIDAMTDINPAAHEHPTGVIFPLLGESGTTVEMIEPLGARSV